MSRLAKLLSLILVQISLFSQQSYTECLYLDWGQTFKLDILYQHASPHQELVVFENSIYGRVLAIDGIIQVTEKDEFIYHEMLSHVPILSHGDVKSVLIIGGGDGGMLREVLRHQSIEKVVLVESDEAVINISKEYLPNISKGAFDDPRAKIVIGDGAIFVEETEERFDIIIVDSTDPIGPGETLFTKSFYGNCHHCLAEGGVLVTQNGVPFFQEDELIQSHGFLSEHFDEVTFYVGVTPTYVGGFMAYGWATDNPKLSQINVEELEERANQLDGGFGYYTPELHKAAFALPQFILDAIESSKEYASTKF